MPAGQDVTFTIESTPMVMGVVKADASGKAKLVWSIPKDFELGAHTVYAQAGALKVSIPVTIAAEPAPATPSDPSTGTQPAKNNPKAAQKLALTGASLGGLVLLGAAWATAGAFLATRRRNVKQ